MENLHNYYYVKIIFMCDNDTSLVYFRVLCNIPHSVLFSFNFFLFSFSSPQSILEIHCLSRICLLLLRKQTVRQAQRKRR